MRQEDVAVDVVAGQRGSARINLRISCVCGVWVVEVAARIFPAAQVEVGQAGREVDDGLGWGRDAVDDAVEFSGLKRRPRGSAGQGC